MKFLELYISLLLHQVVGSAAPAVCDHVWERCEGLRSLTKYLQLTQAVSVSGLKFDPAITDFAHAGVSYERGNGFH